MKTILKPVLKCLCTSQFILMHNQSKQASRLKATVIEQFQLQEAHKTRAKFLTVLIWESTSWRFLNLLSSSGLEILTISLGRSSSWPQAVVKLLSLLCLSLEYSDRSLNFESKTKKTLNKNTLKFRMVKMTYTIKPGPKLLLWYPQPTLLSSRLKL